MAGVMNNLRESEKFGADLQARPLHRVYVDRETQLVLLQEKLNRSAALQEICALADDERASSLYVLIYFGKKLVFPAANEDEVAAFQVRQFIDSPRGEIAIVDCFSADDLIE